MKSKVVREIPANPFLRDARKLKKNLRGAAYCRVSTEMCIRDSCAVVRKGKERFVCEARLAERPAQVRTKANISRRQAASLRILEKTYDLDEAQMCIRDRLILRR